MSAGPLAGRRVLVTRPRERAGALAARIRAAGGEAIVFPAIEIGAPADAAALARVLERLEHYDLAIFVSPTAVERGLAAVRAVRRWPPGLRAAAIGPGTRAALQAAGFSDAIAPRDGADSEALLAHPELAAVAGLRVVVFRGEGGREALAEGLAARGAQVAYAQCYRRLPARDAAGLGAALARADAIVISSAEGLANLLALAPDAGPLRRRPVVVPHARIAERARAAGCTTVLVAGPGEAAIVAALVAYFGAP